MANVFVSYSRQDDEHVEQLVHVFTRYGLTVVYDQLFERGEDWEKRIYREIAAADIVVVCWSSSAANSERVLDEAFEAERLNKYLGCQIAPGGAPGRFGRKNHDDLTHWRGNDKDPRFLKFFSELGHRIDDDEIAGLEAAEQQRLAKIKKDQDAIDAAKQREKEIEEAKKAAVIAATRAREEARLSAEKQRAEELRRRETEKLKSLWSRITPSEQTCSLIFWWSPVVGAIAFFPVAFLLYYLFAAGCRFIVGDDDRWFLGITALWALMALAWFMALGETGNICGTMGAVCGFRS